MAASGACLSSHTTARAITWLTFELQTPPSEHLDQNAEIEPMDESRAFDFFETSCNKQIELIEQRSGIGKSYLQEVRQKYGVTEAERFAKQIKAFLTIKRQMKYLLKKMRAGKKKNVRRK